MTVEYKICKRCVMDTTDTEIIFDENGICNHCKSFEKNLKDRILSEEKGKKYLIKLIEKIKHFGKNKNMIVL